MLKPIFKKKKIRSYIISTEHQQPDCQMIAMVSKAYIEADGAP